MAQPTLAANPSLVLYDATVEIRSTVHDQGRSGSGALIRIDDEAYVATCFHVVGRILEDGRPAFRQDLTIRHLATDELIQFGDAAALAEAFHHGILNRNLDAVLIRIPENNATYVPYALFVEDCAFEDVMGRVVRGYGCKSGRAKFFSGELCSQLADNTFCVSSNSTEKGLSGSACAITNICVGIVQRGTTGRDDPVYVPPGQTVRSLAAFASDSVVTKMFSHSKLTYIVASSVLVRIRNGLHLAINAPDLTFLAHDTVAVHDTDESISTTDDDEEQNLPTRHATRRRSSGMGGFAATGAGAVLPVPVPVPGPVVHHHITNYSCCLMS